MFFKGKHEAARMELRFINKTGNRHFDKPSHECYLPKLDAGNQSYIPFLKGKSGLAGVFLTTIFMIFTS